MDREDRGVRASFVPGEALLSAPVLAAMALTALNDHWLKARAPGVLTGKLSDFAGLYFFPFLAVALIELASELLVRVRRRPRSARRGLRAFAIVLALEAILFVLTKTVPGCAAWLARAWETLFGIHAHFVADPTDLCALIVVPLAWRTARSRVPIEPAVAQDRGRLGERRRTMWRVALLLPLALLLGGCGAFRVRGYEGHAIDYVAAASEPTEAAAAPTAPLVVRSEDVLFVFHPFQIAWLPRVGLLTPAQHARSLDGWIWIENDSGAPLRIVAPLLSTSAEGRVPARAGLVRFRRGASDTERWSQLSPIGSAPRDQPAIPPGEGAWVHASAAIDRSFPAHYELIFRWWEGDRECVFPVAFSRPKP